MNKCVCVTAALLVVLCCLPVTGVSGMDEGGVPEVKVMGSTIVVDGAGGGDYTHIQWAVDNASEGDTIHVRAGTYRENIVLNKSINLIGAGRYNTTIVGVWTFDDTSNCIRITADRVNVCGFNVTHIHDWDKGISHERGILVENANHCLLNDITCWNNEEDGILLHMSNNCTISNSNLSRNSYGILLSESNNNTINNNTYSDNFEGIRLVNSNHNNISNNIVNSSRHIGIELQGALINNTKLTVKNTLSNNIISNSYSYGIYLNYVENNILRNNTCSFCSVGISLESATNTFIFGNILQDNSYDGIGLDSSINITLHNNTFSRCGINIYDGLPSHWNTHVIDTSNNIEDKPIYYWTNRNNGTIPDGAGQIILVNCTEILIENQTLINTSGGIEIGYSNHIHMKKNIISNNNFGAFFTSTNNCEISNNLISHNHGSGCYFANSNDNLITANDFISNELHAIMLSPACSNNTIYHNNFISDTGNDFGLNNHWNGTRYGNYWSYHITSDMNGDYIVDDPLRISPDSYDYRPLVRPVPIALAGSNITIDQHQTAHFNGSASIGDPPFINYTWSFRYNSTNVTLHGSTASFTFHLAGTYVVTLMVANTMGNNDTDRLTVNVIDTEPPVPFAGNDREIDQGIMVPFNGSGSRDNVAIVNYTWNFTYNSTNIILYGISPAFTFDVSGTYIITLNVTDGTGNRASDSFTLIVRDSTRPFANAGDDITIAQHETAIFDGSASYDNVGIVNYTWTFVDQERSVGLYKAVAQYRFDEAGQFPVTLNVSDAAGRWASDSLYVTVLDSTPPVADAGENISLQVGGIVSFNGSHSYDNTGIINYSWRFNYNGTDYTLYGPRPQFTFDVPGNYTVVLRVMDSVELWDEDCILVRVIKEAGTTDTEKPQAVPGDNLTIYVNTTIRFDGSASRDNIGIVNFSWTFVYGGNPVELYGLNPSFRFAIPGNYTVTLRVRDAEWNIDENTFRVRVIERGDISDIENPHAETGGDITVVANSMVRFDASASWDNVGIIDYTWTFVYNGTLMELYGVYPSFRFVIPGSYTVTLRVRDAEWNADESSFLVTVMPVKDPDGGGNDGQRSFGKTAGVFIIFGIAVVVAVVAVVYVLRTRKRGSTGLSRKDVKVKENISVKHGVEADQDETSIDSDTRENLFADWVNLEDGSFKF